MLIKEASFLQGLKLPAPCPRSQHPVGALYSAPVSIPVPEASQYNPAGHGSQDPLASWGWNVPFSQALGWGDPSGQ